MLFIINLASTCGDSFPTSIRNKKEWRQEKSAMHHLNGSLPNFLDNKQFEDFQSQLHLSHDGKHHHGLTHAKLRENRYTEVMWSCRIGALNATTPSYRQMCLLESHRHVHKCLKSSSLHYPNKFINCGLSVCCHHRAVYLVSIIQLDRIFSWVHTIFASYDPISNCWQIWFHAQNLDTRPALTGLARSSSEGLRSCNRSRRCHARLAKLRVSYWSLLPPESIDNQAYPHLLLSSFPRYTEVVIAVEVRGATSSRRCLAWAHD